MTTPVSFSGTGKEKRHEHPRTRTDESGARPRVPRRGRPWLIAIATVLAAGAAYGNYVIVSAQDQRVPALVLARTVGWGQRITDADLAVARAAPDPTLRLISTDDRSRVVGMAATSTLAAGSLLTPDELTDQPVPASDQQLVGLLVKPGQVPARGLRPGDEVQVTPLANTQSASDGSADARTGFKARVIDTGQPDANGAVTVDLIVPSAVADRASAAAAGPVAIAVLGVGN